MSVVVATSRVHSCLVCGNGPYGAKLYGDAFEGDEILLKGSFHGRSDAPMFKAFTQDLPVLVCFHHGRKKFLPAPAAIGKVVSVKEGTNTKNEFRISVVHRFPFKGFEFADPEKNSYCWIKRQFMRRLGLKPVTSNHANCFIECLSTPGTPAWLSLKQ